MVVTPAGRTLQGEVIIDLATSGHESITLKNEDGKKRMMAYEFLSLAKDGEKYVPVKYGEKYRLMKVRSEGYLSLYYFRYEESYEFGTPYLYKRDGAGTEIPNLGFRKRLSDFLSECPAVAESVKAGAYKKSEPEHIIADFNACITKKTQDTKARASENINLWHPALKLIALVRSKVDPENEELMTLLADIEAKIVKGSPVPGYLKNALIRQTSDRVDLKKDVAELLERLQ